jgi:UDP-N-acetylglucosamine acyltransferase
MPNNIHPTAIIGSTVKLGDNISVGPYTVIEKDVFIDDSTEIDSHCVIRGLTRIGKANRIFSSTMIGNDPQDKKFVRGSKTSLEIGDNNVIREFCTFNTGTLEGNSLTKVGSGNLFMAYCHVAHDCIVGDNCVFANAATLGGHVVVEDRVLVGGLAGIHQFSRIGRMSVVGGCAKVVQDVLPFSLTDRNPALVFGLNMVGLRRAKMPPETIRLLKKALKLLLFSGLSKNSAIAQIEKEIGLDVPEVAHIVAFARSSERGLTRGQGAGDEE